MKIVHFGWYWDEWDLGVHRSKVTPGLWRIDVGPLMVILGL